MIIKTYISIALLSLPSIAIGQGLKGMTKTIDKADVKQASETIKEKLPKKEKLSEKRKTEPKKIPRGSTPPNQREAFFELNMAYGSVESDKGSWDSGFGGDFRLGYRLTKLMGDRIELYATYHYLPIHAVVTEQGFEFQGVMEQHLFGVDARYVLQDKLHLHAHGELGAATSKLEAYGIAQDKDLEQSGASILLGGAARWQLMDKFWLGPYISLSSGTFQASHMGASIQLTL